MHFASSYKVGLQQNMTYDPISYSYSFIRVLLFTVSHFNKLV